MLWNKHTHTHTHYIYLYTMVYCTYLITSKRKSWKQYKKYIISVTQDLNIFSNVAVQLLLFIWQYKKSQWKLYNINVVKKIRFILFSYDLIYRYNKLRWFAYCNFYRCGSTTCVGVAGAQLSVSITTLAAAVFMTQLDLRYDPALSPPPRHSDAHTCTAVSMVGTICYLFN